MKQTNTQTAAVQTLERINFFTRREMAELPHLLVPNEQVLAVIGGLYTAGSAVLCVTSKRILLVDKKWIRLNFEDIRYESINEINYSHQAIMAEVKLVVAGREIKFRTWYKAELRMLAQLVQHKMFEIRESKDEAEKSVEDTPPSFTIPAAPQVQSAPSYVDDPRLDQYLSDRIARWRQASRFADTLSVSTKAGRQVMKFEADR